MVIDFLIENRAIFGVLTIGLIPFVTLFFAVKIFKPATMIGKIVTIAIALPAGVILGFVSWALYVTTIFGGV